VVSYTITPAGVVDLHRAHGPDFQTGWLEPLVRRATAERVAAVSYEVVRNHDPELPQAVRAIVVREAAPAGVAIAGLRIGQVAAVGERGGNLPQAQQHLEAAVATGEPVTRAWNSLGEVYLQRGLRRGDISRHRSGTPPRRGTS
jgi:hypothetical protein